MFQSPARSAIATARAARSGGIERSMVTLKDKDEPTAAEAMSRYVVSGLICDAAMRPAPVSNAKSSATTGKLTLSTSNEPSKRPATPRERAATRRLLPESGVCPLALSISRSVPPHHHANGLRRGGSRRHHTHNLSRVHHRYPVAQRQEFLEVDGCIHDRSTALIPSLPDLVVQPLRGTEVQAPRGVAADDHTGRLCQLPCH